jgi:hypothetical protein
MSKKSNKVTYKFCIDGEKWIFFYTEENRSSFKDLTLPVTQMIIDKYEDHPNVNQNKLRILSNQK